MDHTSFSSEEFHRIFANFTTDEMPFNHYEPMNLHRGLLIAAYCFLFICGILGNGWVACVIGVVLHQSTTHPSDGYANETPRSVQIYILSLCSCDLLVITLLIFLLSDLIYGQWVFPSSTFLCRLYLSGEFLNKFAGPILLTGLAAYCYACICLNSPTTELENDYGKRCAAPLLAARRMFNWCGGESAKAALIFVGVGVGFVFVLVAPIYMYSDVQYMVIHNSTIVYTIIPKCALEPRNEAITAFTVYGFILGYIAPSTSFTFFYVSILLHVRRHNRKWRATAERSLYFWRVAKVTGGLVSFYWFCWTPYWFNNLYTYFAPPERNGTGETSTVGIVVSYLVHMLPYINCTGYPILYTLLNGNIKAAYGRAKALRQRRRNQNSHCETSSAWKICCRDYSTKSTQSSGYSQSIMCSDLLTTPPVHRGQISGQTSYTVL